MDAPDSYLELERMIQEGEISPSELERLLVSLQGQQLLTIAEHESLLALAGKANVDKTSPH